MIFCCSSVSDSGNLTSKTIIKFPTIGGAGCSLSLFIPIFLITLVYWGVIIFPLLLLIQYVFPDKCLISNLNPIKASFKEISCLKIKFNPSRVNILLFTTFIKIFISPLILSLIVLPLFCITIISWLSIPAGIGT